MGIKPTLTDIPISARFPACPPQANKLDHIITLVKGKVEEIELPDGLEKVRTLAALPPPLSFVGYARVYHPLII